ncbi:MAG: acyltransferase family protein, partial [Actinomycetes bacterium]
SALLQLGGGGGVAGGGAMLLQPLWFLAVYLALIALTPWSWALHQRFGNALLPVLLVVIVLADVGRVGYDREMAGYVNVVAVWLFVYLLGFAFAQGWFTPRRAVVLVLAGAAALALLVTLGPYPTRMVGIPGDRLSNMHPPTLAVLSLAMVQIGLLVLLRAALARWLQRPRVWFCVVWLNLSIMTLYLWHEFAMVASARLLLAAGLAQPAPGAGSWWVMRFVWVLVAGVVLLGLVVVFGRFERVPTPPPPAPSTTANAVSIGVVVLLFAGLLGLAGTRVTEIAQVQHPMGIPLSPLMALCMIWLATLLLWAVRRLPAAVVEV